MRIEYNGVDLHVIELQRYARRNLYTPDRAVLLGVEHLLAASTVYAPGGRPSLPSAAFMPDVYKRRMSGDDPTAARLAANPRGPDVGQVGPPLLEPAEGTAEMSEWHAGAETDHALYHALMTPRRKLILWARDRRTDSEIRWLESPRVGFEIDQENGPHPISCDVVAASGDGNAVGVLFQVRTVLPPCETGTDKLVLSHRWEMTHGHDDDFYLTRTIRGEIVFHAGVLRLTGTRPDFIRSQFIHTIPLGYERKVPEITASSDGLTIRYTIQDVNPTVVFAPGDSGCTRVDVKERVNLISPRIK